MKIKKGLTSKLQPSQKQLNPIYHETSNKGNDFWIDKMKNGLRELRIPVSILIDENLSWIEKGFLTEIHYLDNNQGCRASNDYFSKFLNISKNRCSAIVKSLEARNYISISYIRKGKEILARIMKIKQIGKSLLPSTYSESRIHTPPSTYSENDEENILINIYNNLNNYINVFRPAIAGAEAHSFISEIKETEPQKTKESYSTGNSAANEKYYANILQKIDEGKTLNNVDLCKYFKYECQQRGYDFKLGKDTGKYAAKFKSISGVYVKNKKLVRDENIEDAFSTGEIIKVIKYYLDNIKTLHRKWKIDTMNPSVNIMLGYLSSYQVDALTELELKENNNLFEPKVVAWA